uniref:Uncharacterized protein n=1 Tax=Anguilla anguilla TaxID=7936 RepID=A0A0E9PG53_ANGAN
MTGGKDRSYAKVLAATDKNRNNFSIWVIDRVLSGAVRDGNIDLRDCTENKHIR